MLSSFRFTVTTRGSAQSYSPEVVLLAAVAKIFLPDLPASSEGKNAANTPMSQLARRRPSDVLADYLLLKLRFP